MVLVVTMAANIKYNVTHELLASRLAGYAFQCQNGLNYEIKYWSVTVMQKAVLILRWSYYQGSLTGGFTVFPLLYQATNLTVHLSAINQAAINLTVHLSAMNQATNLT